MHYRNGTQIMHHTGNSISMAKLTVQNHIANRYSTQADLKKKKKKKKPVAIQFYPKQMNAYLSTFYYISLLYVQQVRPCNISLPLQVLKFFYHELNFMGIVPKLCIAKLHQVSFQASLLFQKAYMEQIKLCKCQNVLVYKSCIC